MESLVTAIIGRLTRQRHYHLGWLLRSGPKEGTLRISQLLDSKGALVVTLAPDARVSELVGEITRRKIGAVVISSDRRTVEGIASERDVVRALNEFGAAILDEPVRAIMTEDVHTSSPEDTVDSLMATMTNHRIRHVPVVDQGVLVGIVSIGDVVKVRMEELEKDREALVNYIGAR
ncbi:MAG: CBS domain-containing protein [Acidimicrobiales bacterium]